MAETLGSLCDKLTIVKLKQWHTDDPARRESLAGQQARLEEEIDAFVGAAAGGALPLDRLTFPSNKVYKRDGNAIAEVQGAIGAVFARLAATNCELWHEREKGLRHRRGPARPANAAGQAPGGPQPGTHRVHRPHRHALPPPRRADAEERRCE